MKPLLISFSGGRTSAFMTAVLMDYHAEREKVVVFANTGREHPKTLEFVNRCDREKGFNVIWVEAVVDPRPQVGTRHKIVDFESACRDGSVYEAVIAKYGIPSKAFPHCTRELKQRPIHSYVRRELGWKDYETAVGIRADERHRESYAQGNGWNVFYPLMPMGITKQIVNEWWSRQPFNLELFEHQGNCLVCWKKSDKKIVRQINEDPSVIEWCEKMERDFQSAGNRTMKTETNFFFRRNRSAKEMKALAFEVARQQVLFDTLSDDEEDCFCKST